MKDKTLTNLIIELNFVIIKQVPSGYLPDSPSSVRDATPWDTLSAFLKLAPNTKRASFGHRWAIQVDELSLLACPKKITGLSISSLEEEEVHYLPEAFPDLKHLELHSLDLFSWPDTNLEKPKGLETLFLHDEIPELSLPFVLATSQTLRFLRVSVFIASALDFTQLTHLQDLTIYPVSDELEEEDIAHLAGGGPGFWPAICGCPALATLTFLFRAPQWNRDDGLTAALSGPPTRIEKGIPTMRTIQFQENIFLDRARFLLSSTLSASLVRFIIPSTLTSQEASRQDKVTYKVVLAMCDEVGVEVYLADE
ncbi:hypothetical protein JCM16303_004095 [Sporobolomyces ruberrimus]